MDIGSHCDIKLCGKRGENAAEEFPGTAPVERRPHARAGLLCRSRSHGSPPPAARRFSPVQV